AERLAREKAWAIFKQRPTDFVLGADTVVVVDKEILGKPRNPADAERLLRLLSGRTHEVIPAVCVMGPKTNAPAGAKNDATLGDTRSETTVVTMSAIRHNEVRAY